MSWTADGPAAVGIGSMRLVAVYRRMAHVGFLWGRLHLAWLEAGRLDFRLERVGGALVLRWARLVVVWGKR